MQKALALEISTWPDDNPRLIGSRCCACAAAAFPAQPPCPNCSGGDMSNVLLSRRGTWVAWTTQGQFTTDDDGNEIVTSVFQPV
jgi:uncharacterized OB-fold protein